MNKIVKILRRQEGQLLIEVLIALVILGIVVVAFLSGLSTASRAIIIADERTTAESLTRTELEYVKSQDFSDTIDPGPWSYQASSDDGQSSAQPTWWDSVNPHKLPDEYQGYFVMVSTEGCDADGDGNPDSDIWRVIVEVYHGEMPALGESPSSDDWVLTTTDYKVDR